MNFDWQKWQQQANKLQSELSKALNLPEEEVKKLIAKAGIDSNVLESGKAALEQGVAWVQEKTSEVNIPSKLGLSQKGINPGNPYTGVNQKLQQLQEYIDKFPSIEALDITTPPATPNDLKEAIERYKQKPNLVLTGGFDAGKSHLANWLLGSKNLPEAYQPATRIITFVRHSEDRPNWCKDDVLILGDGFWQRDEKGQQIIDLMLLNNQERCENNCIIAGEFDVLQKYGVHGENEDISAYAAIVYLNSTLLKACNLVDLPGYSDEPDEVSKDVEKATNAAKIADILIYASPVTGHINGQDMIRLSSLLELLPAAEQEYEDFPTLGNFFVVATHANPSISDDQLKGIPKRAAQRLYKNLGEAVLKRRSEKIKREISEEDLQKRFFTFWSDTPARCQALSDDLTKLLKTLFPKVRMSHISREMQVLVEVNAKKSDILIEEYKSKLANIEHERAKLKALEDNELTRHPESQRRRKKALNKIQELKQATKSSFKRKAAQLLTVDNVERIIRCKYDSKSEAQEYLAGYLTEQLKHELTQISEKNAEEFRREIEDFLKSYQVTLKLPNFNETINVTGFDEKAAFLGGLTGLSGFGALGFWAATLGNLGGYILVAKLVSLLSALGISFGLTGGTAGVMAIVAAIGGPVVLGVALMAGLAMAIWGFFSESWEKRLAKKVVSYFEEQNVCDKFQKAIDDYWEDTAKAFNPAADAVETDWQKYIENFRQDVSGDVASKERLEKIVNILQQLLEFWKRVPTFDWDC